MSETHHDSLPLASEDATDNKGLASATPPTDEAVFVPQRSAYPPFTFSDLAPTVREAVEKAGWTSPLPVQALVVPYLMANLDVIVQSKTGSGKTGAFLLPLLGRIDPHRAVCQALIMVPTRELAAQVTRELEKLTGDSGVRSMAVFGGTAYGPQLDAFKQGVHIVIGTPGRLLDHLGRRSLTLNHLRFLVVDEADELLSMGFYKDMVRIKHYLPAQRVSAMFSATMPESVKRLSAEFLIDPLFLGLSADSVHVTEMDHIYYTVDPMQKDRCLMRIIEVENPPNGIVFCNTKSEVEYLSSLLVRFGYNVDQISGDLTQKQRDIVMSRLRAGHLRFLVATDLAARGIDISDLEYVFIYEMHKDFEQYVHRAGRTGRAGKRGIAVSLVNLIEEVDLKRFATRHGIDLIKRETPCEEDVQLRNSERLLAHLEGELRDANSAQRERMRRYAHLLSEIDTHEERADLLMMMLDGFSEAVKRQGRPQPPTITEERAQKLAADSRDGNRSGRFGRGAGRPSRDRDRKRDHDREHVTRSAAGGLSGHEGGSGGRSGRGFDRSRRGLRPTSGG